MKLTPRTKKLLVLLLFVAAVSLTSGCSMPRNEDGSIVLITNSTTFGEIIENESWFNAFFVFPLAKIINYLSTPIGVGAAIAIVTVVVNGLLAAATLKSTIDTQKMQMIQPELDKIKRKYEGRDDDNSKMRMAAEQQQLMRKYNINPGSMLLITFLQLPIIMAIFFAVQRSEAVQTGFFLGMNLQTTPLNGMKAAISSGGTPMYFVLYALMCILHIISMRIPQILQKKKAEEAARKHHKKPQTPDDSQKIMQYSMIIMILVLGLTLPSAMSLYWSINSIVQIAKTLITQNIIDKQGLKG
ncbi:MAG: YidC/Oxa1 family membrane protein insertase [Solobacterium sp.]|nr:YidC/Oxa1 family membrane protein insertase [Solobacterium sp.]